MNKLTKSEQNLLQLVKTTTHKSIIKELYSKYRRVPSKNYKLIIEGTFQNENLNPEMEKEIIKILKDEKFLYLDMEEQNYYSKLLSKNRSISKTNELLPILIQFSNKDNSIIKELNKTLQDENQTKMINIIKNKANRV